MFEDMNEHFDNIVEVVRNFTGGDAFVEFGDGDGVEREICEVEVYYVNGTYTKTPTTLTGL